MNAVYLDTNIFIYLFENKQPYCDAFLKYYSSTKANFFTSSFTLGELLVQVYRMKRFDLADEYEIKVTQFVEKIIPIDVEISKNFARLRADFPSIKKPDALHLACALKYCTHFLSNDKDLMKHSIPGLTVQGL